MGTPYFGFKFTKYRGGIYFAKMHINSDLSLLFLRPEAPIMRGHWRYVGTVIEEEEMDTVNIPLKRDGYWDKVLEMALHDQLLEGKVK